MVEFSESSADLFLALPRIAKFDKSAVEVVLAELRRRAAGNPLKELEELRGEASFRDATGELADAIALSERALAKCKEVHSSPYEQRSEESALVRRRLTAASADQRRLADQEIEHLARGGRDTCLAEVLMLRAAARLTAANVGDRDPAELDSEQRSAVRDALDDVRRAYACDIEPLERDNVLLARAAICRMLGRDEEGLSATAEAIACFRDRFPVTSLPPTQWTDRLARLQAVYSYRAELLARQHPPGLREVFECADDGRAQLLRHQLAWANVGPEAARLLDRPTFPELRALLWRESAALALFDVGSRHSSVLIVDPRESEPEYRQISITRSELAGVLPPDLSLSQAKPKLFGALPFLSEKLVPPLSRVVSRYPVLYLVPSSELYGIPFAALRLDSGEYLVQQCAVTYVPSPSILKWCVERRKPIGEHSFLALGVGGTKDANGTPISFAAQAAEVTDNVSKLPGVLARVLPAATTAIQLLDQAKSASILHLECHGSLDATANALTASYLQLADRLTADQVAQRRNQFTAELVFLNACLSGTFTRTLKNEAGGFWQAFLLAGATSLVVTLTSVDPRRASELVTGFYDEWLGRGLDKARALQAAQQNMVASGVGPEHWATHILVGDYR